MADNPSPTRDGDDFERWYGPPTADFNDPWSDPADLRARERRQIRRYQWGFSALGLALVVAGMFSVGGLLAFFFKLPQLGIAIQGWDFWEETVVVLSSFVGVGLLWGRWPDESWRRRSGLLLFMCLIDVVLWSLDHATRLGLSDVAIGHEYFRRSLGQALSWSEFALIASLSSGMTTHLGESRALDLGRAPRSLATVGASVWFVYFFLRTNWNPPIWPLRENPFDFRLFPILTGWLFLSTLVLVQVTLLCLYAGRTCGRAVRAINAEERRDESFLSRSEIGWNEYHKKDNDRHTHQS